MKTQNRERICAVLFLLPSALLLLIFVLWPMLYSGVMSFFNWDPLKGASFIGIKNFVKLMGDKLWWTSLANTLFYIVLNVPLIILLALAMSELVVALAKRSMFYPSFLRAYIFTGSIVAGGDKYRLAVSAEHQYRFDQWDPGHAGIGSGWVVYKQQAGYALYRHHYDLALGWVLYGYDRGRAPEYF